jgi:hypothetical protein
MPESSSLNFALKAAETRDYGRFAQETRPLDVTNLRGHFKAGAQAVPADVAGAGFTYRQDWGNWNGQAVLTLTWSGFTNDTRVFVAIGEGAPGGGKFVGAARFTLHNVAPQAGNVAIWVEIEWNYPIRLYVDYLIVNP